MVVIKMVILFLLIFINCHVNGMDISDQFEGMFGSITKDSNNMKTEKDENGNAQLHVRMLIN